MTDKKRRSPEPWDVWEHKLDALWVVMRVKRIESERGEELYIELTPLKGKYTGARSSCSVETFHRDYKFKCSLLDNEKLYYSTMGKA